MGTSLDGNELFDELHLEIFGDSFTRASKEKNVLGLDGVLSIDMGKRSRKVKQNGTLRAKSKTHLLSRLNVISNYIDGSTHTLISNDGRQFENLRMDSFKTGSIKTNGIGLMVGYTIVYTQLF